MNPALLLAHQGGWDEMLLVAGPIALVVSLIRLARKRADAMESARVTAPQAPTDHRTQRADGSPIVERGSGTLKVGGQDGPAVT